jgi:NDP-sugar pyrophosphorylase family protein
MKLFEDYCPSLFRQLESVLTTFEPWDVCQDLESVLEKLFQSAGSSYDASDGIAVHRTATVHPTAVMSDPIFICAGVTVGPHAVLRGGVYIGEDTHIGGSVEIKQSIIGPRSAVAHLNYVGDSIIGEDVNIEAGAIVANHFNEKLPEDREISVLADGRRIKTGVTKFGALIGDHCRIGANAVTSPGTLLVPGSVVARLELVQ